MTAPKKRKTAEEIEQDAEKAALTFAIFLYFNEAKSRELSIEQLRQIAQIINL